MWSVATELGCASLGVFWLDKVPHQGVPAEHRVGDVQLKGLCVCVTSEGNCLQQSLLKLYFPQVCT